MSASRCRRSWGRRREYRYRPSRRRDPGREDRRQGAELGRAHPGLPGSDRRHRRAIPRLPPCGCRSGAGHRRWRRCRRRCRGGAALTADRGSVGAQGRLHDHRHADHLWIQDPRRLGVAVRRDGHRTHPRRRHTDPRQDQYGRVRDGFVDGELRLRPDPQPVGYRPCSRWLRRRQRGCTRIVSGSAGHRLRYRWLDPPTRRTDRDGWGEAHLRNRVPLRPGCLRVIAGSGWPVCAHGARHRTAARGDRRIRPARLDVVVRGASGGGGCGPGRRHARPHGCADRGGETVAQRGGLSAGRPGVLQRRRRATHRPRRGHQ